MLWTVFPKDERLLPQDFASFQEAAEYAEEQLDCEYVIESTTGEIV